MGLRRRDLVLLAPKARRCGTPPAPVEGHGNEVALARDRPAEEGTNMPTPAPNPRSSAEFDRQSTTDLPEVEPQQLALGLFAPRQRGYRHHSCRNTR